MHFVRGGSGVCGRGYLKLFKCVCRDVFAYLIS